MGKTVKLYCGDYHIWVAVQDDAPQWEAFEAWRPEYCTNPHPWAAWQAAIASVEEDHEQKQDQIERMEAAVPLAAAPKPEEKA